MVDIPYPIRTAKSSTIGPNQYCGGGPRGNLGCRMFFFFGPFLTMFWSKTWTWRPIVNIPLPHFFGKQADLWRMLGISNCFFTLFFCFNPRLCGIVFFSLHTLFGRFAGFHCFFSLRIQRMQNAPPNREKKEKQTGKPRLNLTRSLQQGNSR